MSSKRIVILGAFVAAAAVGLVAAAAYGRHTAAPTIAVSDSACAPGWSAASGRTIFTVQNTAPHDFFTVEVVSGANPLLAANPVSAEYAAAAANAPVYGQINMVAPETSVPLDVVLPPGRYFIHCLDSNGNTLNSPIVSVTGPPASGAHPYSPVTPNQLAYAMQAYRGEIGPVMKRLALDTDRLAQAVRAGRLALARTLWLPAHLDYARLGVAYGTFGALNDEIDGRPLGLAGGVHSPDFQGFLRLEYGLWHGQPSSQLRPVAAALARSVRDLVKKAGSPAGMIWVNTDLPLRAHEILENTLQFELTGETNEGSNTNLATAWANTQGETFALDALKPLLRTRDAALLATATAGTTRLTAAFAAYKKPNGRWTGLGSLTTAQREQLDSATSNLLEELEQIPDELRLALLAPAND